MSTEVFEPVDRARALEELYLRNAGHSVSPIFLTRDRDQAENLVQEAFVRRRKIPTPSTYALSSLDR